MVLITRISLTALAMRALRRAEITGPNTLQADN